MELVSKAQKINKIGDFDIQKQLLIIAGPCAIESFEQMDSVAKLLVAKGIKFIRAYSDKPRTSPYSFQGLGKSSHDIIKQIKQKYSLKIVSELLNFDDLPFFLENVDIIQIGARNMQNFELLKRLGQIQKPVILKRGFGNTIEEWLMAAEYLLKFGNSQIILCERGIRSFEPMTRNTLDISSIPIIKQITALPIIADPSHACGRSDLVKPLSLASLAAGADGLLLEIHPNPNLSLSDKEQALSLNEFSVLLDEIKKLSTLRNISF
ncbi:MAG: bifunctional 3-deoxy-7-phosphoheptulonate synthase/chorismate mutase [Bacilli bacterium]